MGFVLDPFPYLSTACTAGVHEVCPDPKACKCRCGHPDVASSSSDQTRGRGRSGEDDGAPESSAVPAVRPVPPTGLGSWRPFDKAAHGAMNTVGQRREGLSPSRSTQ